MEEVGEAYEDLHLDAELELGNGYRRADSQSVADSLLPDELDYYLQLEVNRAMRTGSITSYNPFGVETDSTSSSSEDGSDFSEFDKIYASNGSSNLESVMVSSKTSTNFHNSSHREPPVENEQPAILLRPKFALLAVKNKPPVRTGEKAEEEQEKPSLFKKTRGFFLSASAKTLISNPKLSLGGSTKDETSISAYDMDIMSESSVYLEDSTNAFVNLKEVKEPNKRREDEEPLIKKQSSSRTSLPAYLMKVKAGSSMPLQGSNSSLFMDYAEHDSMVSAAWDDVKTMKDLHVPALGTAWPQPSSRVREAVKQSLLSNRAKTPIPLSSLIADIKWMMVNDDKNLVVHELIEV